MTPPGTAGTAPCAGAAAGATAPTAGGSPQLGTSALDVATLLARVDRGLVRVLPGVALVTGEVGEPIAGRGWVRCMLFQPVGDELATLPLSLTRPHLDRIRREVAPATLERLLAPGQTVTVAGRVRRSARTGKIELRVERVDAAVGEGLLAHRRREAELRLRAEGLLDRQRLHRRLPLAPLRVALVSGWDSDGLADARRVLADSGYFVRCQPYQERMEGPGAVARIARAVQQAAGGGNDVVLLVRGGGPSMALRPFDAEVIARAVAEAPVPVLTGIGHQRNHTLADAVAHQACISPTGAAERIVRQLRQAETQLHQAATRALDAATAAQGRRDAQWRRARRIALLALGTGAAAAQLDSLTLLTIAMLIALVAALAAPPTGRGRGHGPDHRNPSHRNPDHGNVGHGSPDHDPRHHPGLPPDVEGVIATLDALAGTLHTEAGIHAVARLRGRAQTLREHGHRLLRGQPTVAAAAPGRHPPRGPRALPDPNRNQHRNSGGHETRNSSSHPGDTGWDEPRGTK